MHLTTITVQRQMSDNFDNTLMGRPEHKRSEVMSRMCVYIYIIDSLTTGRAHM